MDGTQTLLALKTQLSVAVGQREEDPERAWLEAVSVRDQLGGVIDATSPEEKLYAEAIRFRSRLDEAIAKLTRDVGDEVVAPLYSWIDLVRQRDRLVADVSIAKSRVAEARAARGATSSAIPETAADASAAVESSEKELGWWRSELPPLPSPEALDFWAREGGDALRASMSVDPAEVRARGSAARTVIEPGRGRASNYAGSRLELLLLPAIGAAALLSAMFAFASAGPHLVLDALAALGCGSFAAALVASAQARRRAGVERQGMLDVVWNYTLFSEQASLVDLEAGWLRALAAALRAKQAFEAREGGQLTELASWRPDLTEVVVDVAKSSLVPPAP